MPAFDPVCARDGMLASASAAAVVSAMAREAGLAGRALLGGLAAIIWDNVSVPRAGSQIMDGTGYGQHTVETLAVVDLRVTKPGEYGSSGAVARRSIPGM